MKKILVLIVISGFVSACSTPQKNEPAREPQQVIGQVGVDFDLQYVLRCAGMNTTAGKTDLIDKDYTFKLLANDEYKAEATETLDGGRYIVRVSASYRVFQGVPLQNVSVEVENVKANTLSFSLDPSIAKIDIIKNLKKKFENSLNLACRIVKK